MSTSLPRVVSIAYRGLSLFETGIVAEVFGLRRPGVVPPLYRFSVAQAEPGRLRTAGGLSVQADGGLRLLRDAALVVIPGWRNHLEAPPAALIRTLRNAHEGGARLMSICTGAFVLVSPPHRAGGQAQYIVEPVTRHESRGLAQVMSWASERLAEPITVARLARRAAMSERTLLRHFLAQVGTTPKAWLLQERVRQAQRLLERSDLPLERISARCGFASTETFRATFRRIARVAPSVYRRGFRGL